MVENNTATTDNTAQNRPGVTSQGSYLVLILAMVYTIHSLDRNIMSVIIEPVKAELDLSDQAMGLIVGLSYAVSFSIAGIALGPVIDRVNRRSLISALVFIWSAMTAVASLASTGLQLMVSRALVGAAESGSTPIAFSLLADSFPSAKRATVVGLFSVGAGIGAIISGVAGGYITEAFGWRTALVVAGIPGMILAVVILITIREPVRGGMDVAASASQPGGKQGLMGAMHKIATQPVILVTYAAGTSLILAMAGLSTWLMPYFLREYQLDLATAGLTFALSLGLGVTFGAGAGGYISDRIGKKFPSNRLYFCSLISLLCCITSAAAFSTSHFGIAIAAFAFWNFLAFMHAGPTLGTILNLFPSESRGSGSAIYQVAINLIGYGLGPFFVGSVSDAIGGDGSLKTSLIIVVGSSSLTAMILYSIAGRMLSQRQYNTVK